jgi:protein-S-isoprenylcysteine O-methyltransferase Ste14
MSQKKSWLIVVLIAILVYVVIRLGQSALGLEFIFHGQLPVGDQRWSWVVLSVVLPFAIALGLFLASTAMSRSTKVVTFLGTWIVYASLISQTILSMSGAWLLILPLVLPFQLIAGPLGLNARGYLPIRGTSAQDAVVPALIGLGVAISMVGLVQIVRGARSKSLVTRGLYATMRHPQHLGILLWTLGFALWGAYVLDFLIWFTLVYAFILLALHEEGNLAKQFGARYLAYQQNTRFMTPFVPKKGLLLGSGDGKGTAIMAGVYVVGIAAILGLFCFAGVSW